MIAAQLKLDCTLIMRGRSDTELGKTRQKKNSLLSFFTSLYRLLQKANVVRIESMDEKSASLIPIISWILLEADSVIADFAPKYSPPDIHRLSESTR